MKMSLLKSMTAAVLLFAVTGAVAQEPRPYTEGVVTNVTYIRTKPGMFDAYMKWVATERKALMEEYRKAGLIVGWKVYSKEPRNPREADIWLTVTYKNWAAFDGLRDKEEPIAAKIAGSLDKQTQAVISREQMREVLGSELVQEMVIK